LWLCLVAPINPRNNEYLRDARASANLTGLRLKLFIEQNSEYKVDVIHSDVQNPYEVDYSKYEYVGITSYHPTMEYDLRFAKAVSEIFNVTVVFGGPNPSFLPEVYSEYGIVVQGEGEKLLLKILNEHIYEGVYGWGDLSLELWRELTVNTPIEQAPWEEIWQFNRVNYGVREAIRIISQIGCKRKCVFCSVPNFTKTIKYLTTEQLKFVCDKASSLLPKTGVIMLQGDDELYGKAKRRFFELYEQGYRFKHPVILQTEANRIDDEIAYVLKELNVEMVGLGVESFSQNILDEFEKKVTVEDNERALEVLLEHGITPYANMILRGLESSDEDVEYTLERIEYWKKRGVRFGINKYTIPLPGSKLWQKQKNRKIKSS